MGIYFGRKSGQLAARPPRSIADRAGMFRAAFWLVALFALLALAAWLLAGGARPSRAATGGAADESRPGCYPPGLVTEIRGLARRGRGYAPPSSEECRAFRAEAARLSAKYRVSPPIRALESAHGQERALRARARTSSPRRWGPPLRADHLRGRPAAEIAARRGLPPMFVLKALYPPGAPPPPAEEARDASLADAGSAFHQSRARRRAEAYEAEVGEALARLGAAHSTEESLRAEGAPVTPDFLLDRPLALCGQQVAWLDAKDYFYYGNPLTLPGLKAQARKYTAAFGPGAMVFAGGVSCGAPPLGALLLGPDWASHAAQRRGSPPPRGAEARRRKPGRHKEMPD